VFLAEPTQKLSPQAPAAPAQSVPFLLAAQSAACVPRIAEEELTLEEVVGEGAFSVVWRATWRRAIAVGKQRVTATQVTVKMSNRMTMSNTNYNNNNMNNVNNNMWLQSLTRDLAVISGLPHQNILTLHGVCESKQQQQQTTYANKHQAATSTLSPSSYSSSSSSFSSSSLWIVYELMTSDLAKLLQAAVKEQKQKRKQQQEQQEQQEQEQQQSSSSSIGLHHTPRLSPPPRQLLQLLPTNVLLRVLRDVSAGLAHLHSHGVVHRDVKPANILLRGDEQEQVKLCDFGSSKDLKHTLQQMSVAGTLDYMAPEVLKRQASGRPVDVWSFGVLLFECVVGKASTPTATIDELVEELSQAGCLPSLVELFVECHQQDHTKRPLMSAIHSRLQKLVMHDARDSHRLREELKRAEAQDKETYESTWNDSYANQTHSRELLEYVADMKSPAKLGFLFSLLPFFFFCSIDIPTH